MFLEKKNLNLNIFSNIHQTSDFFLNLTYIIARKHYFNKILEKYLNLEIYLFFLEKNKLFLWQTSVHDHKDMPK